MVTLKLHILANILWYNISLWTLSLITHATALCCYWCEISMCKLIVAGAFAEMSAWWWLLVTETCCKLYIIEYIVVFWLNDFLVIYRIGYFSEEKRCPNTKDLKKLSYYKSVHTECPSVLCLSMEASLHRNLALCCIIHYTFLSQRHDKTASFPCIFYIIPYTLSYVTVCRCKYRLKLLSSEI
jgi:hypothetical protein